MTARSIDRRRHDVLDDRERRKIHWLGLFMSDPVIVSLVV